MTTDPVADATARLLHVDASLGLAGDMLLAAVVDAGADLAGINSSLAAIDPGLAVRAEPTLRKGFRAVAVTVVSPAEPFPARWPDVRRLVLSAPIDRAVRERSVGVLERLAHAEANVHGVDVEQVHFHEVAAWDTVADVVGVIAGVEGLRPGRISATPIAVGRGTVNSRHGVLPVPPPAVTELLRTSDVPYSAGPAAFESCTPTGAALLSGLAQSWDMDGPAVIDAVGTGAGRRDPDTHANVTRVLLGRPWSPQELDTSAAVVLHTNVDDMDPRLWPDVLDRILAAGAWDAWLSPISMKKGRPATTLSILCAQADHGRLGVLVLESTTAIGMRVVPVGRITAEREVVEVDVKGAAVRVKVARWGGRIVNVQPEWEDVAALAARLGRPPKEVLAQAHDAAARLRSDV